MAKGEFVKLTPPYSSLKNDQLKTHPSMMTPGTTTPDHNGYSTPSGSESASQSDPIAIVGMGKALLPCLLVSLRRLEVASWSTGYDGLSSISPHHA